MNAFNFHPLQPTDKSLAFALGWEARVRFPPIWSQSFHSAESHSCFPASFPVFSFLLTGARQQYLLVSSATLKGGIFPWPCAPPAVVVFSFSSTLSRCQTRLAALTLSIFPPPVCHGFSFQFSKIPASGSILTKHSSDLSFFFFNINLFILIGG